MKEKKTKAIKQISPVGIRVHPELHDLMKKAVPLVNFQLGDAYTEAAVDWLKKQASSNSVLRALLHQSADANPEIRDLLGHRRSSTFSKPA